MKRSLLSLLVAAGLIFGLTACNPQEISKDAIRQHFPAAEHDKAIRVAQCESGLNSEAVSPGGGNHGLFQINSVHKAAFERMGYSWSQITDPYANARFARVLYNERGWAPWPHCGKR